MVGRQGDEHRHRFPLDLVGPAHGRGFGHRIVAHQRAFDLDRAQPVTGNVEHVINAAHDPVVAVVVATGIVAAEIFSGELLGTAEKELVLEEFLDGEELSFFALCDGKHAVALAAAQDHKRIGEGDTGPNTGGMGAYTADGLMSADLEQWLLKNVAQRVVDEMAREGTPFHGILFCGMMMTPQSDGSIKPMVLEFNTRFGDPETEAILVRMESDILDLFDAAIDGTADRLTIQMRPGASVCVIAASAGYPGKYPSGLPISGLDQQHPDTVVFHAGTASKDGAVVTAGGRVLAVTAVSGEPSSASTTPLESALAGAYAALEKISFNNMQFRRDIAWRALRKGL